MSLREPLPPLRVYDANLGKTVLNPEIRAIIDQQIAVVVAQVKRQSREMRAGSVKPVAEGTDDVA